MESGGHFTFTKGLKCRLLILTLNLVKKTKITETHLQNYKMFFIHFVSCYWTIPCYVLYMNIFMNHVINYLLTDMVDFIFDIKRTTLSNVNI